MLSGSCLRDQNYLLKRMQAEGEDSLPFQIIHNFRKNSTGVDRPRRKISACERLQHIPEFTMRTRKMTAEIELKQEVSPRFHSHNQESRSNQAEAPLKLEDPEQFLLREDALENGIPFGQQDQADLLFSLEENSHASNYSKLERALFGFGMQEEMEEELQPNDGMGLEGL